LKATRKFKESAVLSRQAAKYVEDGKEVLKERRHRGNAKRVYWYQKCDIVAYICAWIRL